MKFAKILAFALVVSLLFSSSFAFHWFRGIYFQQKLPAKSKTDNMEKFVEDVMKKAINIDKLSLDELNNLEKELTKKADEYCKGLGKNKRGMLLRFRIRAGCARIKEALKNFKNAKNEYEKLIKEKTANKKAEVLVTLKKFYEDLAKVVDKGEHPQEVFKRLKVAPKTLEKRIASHLVELEKIEKEENEKKIALEAAKLELQKSLAKLGDALLRNEKSSAKALAKAVEKYADAKEKETFFKENDKDLEDFYNTMVELVAAIREYMDAKDYAGIPEEASKLLDEIVDGSLELSKKWDEYKSEYSPAKREQLFNDIKEHLQNDLKKVKKILELIAK